MGHYSTIPTEVVSNLNISAVHTNDGGLYRCVASSKVGNAEHSARLNVYGLPFVRPMEKAAVVAGEMMIVTCPVAGYPIDTIQWEKGKFGLSRSSRAHGTLQIKIKIKFKK
jgi:Immunoglobulin I-set domain